MAEEWIKFRRKLRFDGRVRKMSRDLRTNVPHILGCLSVLWMLADEFADDGGRLNGYEKDDIDAEVGVEGFCDALPADWFEQRPDGIYLPDYQEHNGSTAKRRAEDAKRKRNVRKTSAKCPQRCGQNADQRREEKNKRKPPTPFEVEMPENLKTEAFKVSWAEWIAYRQRAGFKRYVPEGAQRQLNTLAKWGPAKACAAIDNSIRQGWKGLFEPDAQQTSKGEIRKPAGGAPPPLSDEYRTSPASGLTPEQKREILQQATSEVRR